MRLLGRDRFNDSCFRSRLQDSERLSRQKTPGSTSEVFNQSRVEALHSCHWRTGASLQEMPRFARPVFSRHVIKSLSNLGSVWRPLRVRRGVFRCRMRNRLEKQNHPIQLTHNRQPTLSANSKWSAEPGAPGRKARSTHSSAATAVLDSSAQSITPLGSAGAGLKRVRRPQTQLSEESRYRTYGR